MQRHPREVEGVQKLNRDIGTVVWLLVLLGDRVGTLEDSHFPGHLLKDLGVDFIHIDVLCCEDRSLAEVLQGRLILKIYVS